MLKLSNRGPEGNDPILDVFLYAVKRLDYDHEMRLLTAVVASKKAAAVWDNCTFKLQYGTLVFVADGVTNPAASADVFTAIALTRLYNL